MSSTNRVISVSMALVLTIAPIAAVPAYANTPAVVSPTAPPSDAGSALREGKRLLKRGQADKALIQLRNALNLYTAAKDNSGIAAAHSRALGKIAAEIAQTIAGMRSVKPQGVR